MRALLATLWLTLALAAGVGAQTFPSPDHTKVQGTSRFQTIVADSVLNPTGTATSEAIPSTLVCDGSTDNATVLNAYLATLAATTGYGRGHIVFPAGTCVFGSSIKWPKVVRNGVVGIGATIEGAGAGATILSYTGTSWLFVVGDDTGTDNIANFVFRNFAVKVTSASAKGVFLLNDPTITSTFENLDLQGAGSTGTAMLLHGQTSCVCHNTFRNLKFSSFNRNIQASGFTNANDFTQLENVTTADAALDFEPVAANAVCAANGEPYACCSGSGAGSSAAGCAADTRGGGDNTVNRLEMSSGVALGLRIVNPSDRNVFVKAICDGATACVSNQEAAGGTLFVGSLLSPDPTGTGIASYYQSAYSGNDSLIDPDKLFNDELNVFPLAGGGGGSQFLQAKAATANPKGQWRCAGLSGSDECRFRTDSNFMTWYTGAVERMRIDTTGIVRIDSDTGASGSQEIRNRSTSDGRAITRYTADRSSTASWDIGIDPDGGTNKSYCVRDVTNGNTIRLCMDSTGKTVFADNTKTATTKVDIDGGLRLRAGAVSLTADNQAVTVADRSYLRLTSDNATSTNRTFTLSAGQQGQPLVLELVSNGNAAELISTGNVKLAGAATWTATADDILSLIYNGTNWLEQYRAAN